LRTLRRDIAAERDWQPYLVFSDASLRELARVRPSTLEKMRLVYGVGEVKLRDFGQRFLRAILDFSAQHGLSLDNPSAPPAEEPRGAARPNASRTAAFELFRQGLVVEDVMHQTGRARSTVMDYLCEYIRAQRPASIAAWVRPEIYERVVAAARTVGTDRLKPVYIALGEQISYDEIRLVLAHLAALASPREGGRTGGEMTNR
jgi:ATP-dependent DNA helicase RecQ